ncbi:MAG: BspA family leucine-rich repeat surface protein [Bacteroidaceae bacterium]|nr:BspA family leucine-rich repeat surface protein [Bacteroidaceae bacterium]
MKPRNILALLLLLVAGLQSIKAQEAYTVFTEADSTLTFYYDTERDSRPGTAYLVTNEFPPRWNSVRGKISKVVFDPSFADARPTTTNCWFRMKKLKSITGISYLNTSEVTSMREMFHECNALTSLDVSGFNTAKVTTMSSMFSDCTVLTSLDVSNFNTANVTSMAYMFNCCRGLTSLDVSNFNTANVTSMSYMFRICSKLTSLDVSHFNTENVTNMYNMFYGCTGLTSLDVSHFDTKNVTNMSEMFSACSSLTSLDVSNFNTANVTSMIRMFERCDDLISLDLSSFNTENVTHMSEMFNTCASLRRIYVGSEWSTASVNSSSDMFLGCKSLVGEKGTTYDENHLDASYAHLDDGAENPGYLSTVGTPLPLEAYTVFTEADSTLTFYYDNQYTSRQGILYDLNMGNEYPDWYKDRNNSKVFTVVFDPSFADARPTSTYSWFGEMHNLTSITGLSYLNTSEVTTMVMMFYKCYCLFSLDVSHFNTANVTDIAAMFYECSHLFKLDVRNFNTANVTNMSWMFYNCHSLTILDLSNFNTENVTNMSYMFSYCTDLGYLVVSSFNTEKVTDMSYMFYGCTELIELIGVNFNTENVTDMRSMFRGCSKMTYLDLSNFNTQNVKYMNHMFSSCNGLNCLDVSDFNTENVTDMSNMFYNCPYLTSLDVSSFNTENVTDMSNMFGNCNSLERIYVGSGWSTASVTESTDMFLGSRILAGEKGTWYNVSHVDASYAHLDGGTNNPGYLSTKLFDFMVGGIYYRYGFDVVLGNAGPGSDYVEVSFRDMAYDTYTAVAYSIPETVTHKGKTYTVTGIGASAFKQCRDLRWIYLPSTLRVIRESAFAGDENLELIYCYAMTPPTITLDDAFEGYTTDAAKLYIHGSAFDAYKTAQWWSYFCELRNIDGYDFVENGIYYQIQPDGRSVYVSNAYNYKTNKYDFNYSGGEYYIPETVTHNGTTYTVTGVAAQAFWNNSSLVNIALPKTIQAIEACAFNCSSLEMVVCHATTPPVLSAFAIDEENFNGCFFVPRMAYGSYEDADVWHDLSCIDMLPYDFEVDGLYYYSGTEGEVNLTVKDDFFNSDNYVGAIDIPETVTYQGTTYTVVAIENTFYGSVNLTEVTIPATVTSIGNNAFYGCTSLATVTCNATTPPSLDKGAFNSSHYQNVIVYVPYGCHDAYMYAPVWKNFYGIFEQPDGLDEIPETIENGNIYNLAGQRLQKMQKGINIVGERKVLVK